MNLRHIELSMAELQTFSDSQAEDIEIWKGKVKMLEQEIKEVKALYNIAIDVRDDFMEENERLKADLAAADARGDE